MISAFGAGAQRYARALGVGTFDAVIADQGAIGSAYIEAIARRERGEAFYTMVLWDDPRVAFGYRYANQILAQLEDYDFRRIVLDQLTLGSLPVNGLPISSAWKADPTLEGIATEFLALGDAMLVRSYAEIASMETWFTGTIPPRIMPPIERVLANVTLPVAARERPAAPSVVIWAPHREAIETALHLEALTDFHGAVTCVTAGGPPPARGGAAFLAPGDAASVLLTASVIVCMEPNDPADAVAFARLGYGVVAPATSGAHEFAGDILPCDPLNPRFMFTAVAAAMARESAVLVEPPLPPRAPAPPGLPAFVDRTELPLVTIVTPTYNRRDELKKMLSCLAAQTYPKIEAIVVNDGGVAIDDIVEAFPFARLIEQRPNAGALRAVELGRGEARGDYIGLLPDDDWIYPDHVERIVYAALRSGAAIAHGCALLRFVEPSGNGMWRTRGFNNRTFSQTQMPTEALVSATLGGHQMLVHRSAYEAAGGYLLDSDIADNEIHVRFTQRYFYAFVNHVTAEFRDHAGGQGRRCDFPAALRDVYENLHPVPGRPLLMRTRQATIENVASRPPGEPPFPMTLLLNTDPAVR
jgi:hypothetical protein